MIGNAKRKGYVYQDILSAFIVAKEIYNGEFYSEFLFDVKKTEKDVSDKFDDISVFKKDYSIFYQIKYSDEFNAHKLTKSDFSQKKKYDLALQTLYESWKALKNRTNNFKICLAWSLPEANDDIQNYITYIDGNTLFPNSRCFKFDIDKIWPNEDIAAKWRSLKNYVKKKCISKESFSTFLDQLIIEINLPKTSLLENFKGEIDSYYLKLLKDIGIGQYPNNRQLPEECAYKLCNYIRAKAAKGEKAKIKCDEILSYLHIITDFGGIKENFPIDKNIIAKTPERVSQIKNILNTESKVLIVGDPGSGKSWFIDNLEQEVKNNYIIIKHYCYTDLTDSLLKERITSNIFFGSLLAQLNKLKFVNFNKLPNKYASNLENLNKVLDSVNQPLLIVIDGLDHIYRIFEQNASEIREDEIQIIEAISKINITNYRIRIIVLSQSISQLNILSDFYKFKLPKVNEKYIKTLLPKYQINNFTIDNETLSQKINAKAEGNPLFISYILKECKKNNSKNTFDWIENIPNYDYNLKAYYSYIISKFNNSLDISMVLCCIDYSVTRKELEEITKKGDYVKEQLQALAPILHNTHGYGYSIYHESYKRYILEEVEKKNISIKQAVLPNLIAWLENKGFYSNIKAYSFLLLYYIENHDYQKIEHYISLDFLYKSLSNLFPIQTIEKNHKLLLQAINYIKKLDKEIILIQQTQAITIFEELTDDTIGAFLLASKEVNSEDSVYNFLYPNEELTFDVSTTLKILKYLCLHGFSNINWNILYDYKTKKQKEDVGCIITQLLNQERYTQINNFINSNIEIETNAEFWLDVFDNFEWYYLIIDSSIITKCPSIIKAYYRYLYPSESFHDLLEMILKNKYFSDKAQAVKIFMQLFWSVRHTQEKTIEDEIKQITERFWFRNWIIFVIKIIKLSQRAYSYEELINTFSLLCKDVDPFKGKPRACDLHLLENLIQKTYYLGLRLCKNNLKVTIKIFDILEKVTETQTTFENIPSGPLTKLKYLEMKTFYLHENSIKEYPTIEEIYITNSFYHASAEQFFFYSYLLSKQHNYDESNKYYSEGIKSLLGIRFHKDYSLTDLLFSSLEYQKYTNSLSKDFFFKLERLSYLMQYHTDRRDVGDYPDDWFVFFNQLYPEDSIKYLIYQTIHSDMVYGYFEYAFKIFLENDYAIKKPTLWFLLWLSLPIMESEQIITLGFQLRDKIDLRLQPFFDEWMKNRVTIHQNSESPSFSQEIIEKYKTVYNIELKGDSSLNNLETITINKKNTEPFSDLSFDGSLNYLKTMDHEKRYDLINLQKYIITLSDFKQKKQIIIEIAKKFAYQYLDDIEIIFENSSNEYIFFNIALFVYTNSGGFEVLTNFNFLKNAYVINQHKTLEYLKEILSTYIVDHFISYKLSSNLIIALIKLELPKNEIQILFEILDTSITNRFPDAQYNNFKEKYYLNLENYSYEELIITLLLSRLKTFTGEKNRNILLGIQYIALTTPGLLLKPYSYIFSLPQLLLPSQRAVLLQLFFDSVPMILISNEFKNLLKSNYPTQFFLEDFYIRKICNSESKLLPCLPNRFAYSSHEKDEKLLIFLNDKYKLLVKDFGVIEGFYNEYQKFREELSEKYQKYSMILERIFAPIVNCQDVVYQIINQRLYERFDYLEKENTFNTDMLRFFINESIQNITSLSKRPDFLPYPETIDNNRKNIRTYFDNNWVLLCAIEKQYISIDNNKKYAIYSKIRVVSYEPYEPYEQPVIEKNNHEEIDKNNIFLLSGFLVNKMSLKYNNDIFTGYYYEKNGKIVAKCITWKENYMGSVSEGFEIPTFEGSALLVKKEFLDEIETFYDKRLVLLQEMDDPCSF